MDAYGFPSRCRRLATEAVRELFTQLKTFGAALIGAPLPPEAFPPVRRGQRPVTGPDVTPPVDRAGAAPGTPPAGHPERLIPHVPPTATERRLWSQLR